MNRQKKDKGPLVGGLLLFLLGALTLIRGRASLYGVVGIFGGQAKAFAWFCIAFSLVLLLVYLRRGN
jgi:K+ transporter